MTRINTNVGSLVAQTRLARNNSDLQTALTRLSTGLRINSGKDDPAGLIASEGLRSDITAINRAIGNTDRANQLIATADSALGQVSSLLNDIRGLVTEAANTGGLSSEQVAANQLQVDSSLEAIDRIARVTTFQGTKLLNGGLDFLVTGGSNFNRISNLQVQQANLGATGEVSVDVNVTTAAAQAQVDLTIPAATAAANASASFSVTNTAAQATGAINSGVGGFVTAGATLTITAVAGGVATGASGNDIDVVFTDTNDTSGAVGSVTYNAGSRILTVNADLTTGVTTAAIATAIQNLGGAGVNFTASGNATALGVADVGTYADVTAGGRDAGSATFQVTADNAGSAPNGVTVTLIEDATLVGTDVTQASFNGANIEVRVKGTVTKTSIATAIDGLAGYSASITAASGDTSYIQSSDVPPAAATLTNGVDASGGLTQDVVFELSGEDGTEAFSFKAGATINQLQAAIEAVSDATGVNAVIQGTTLSLTSTGYGSAAFVDIKIVSEASGGSLTTTLGGQGTRETGTDVVATVNGIQATGKGNSLSINSATLDLSLTVAAAFTGSANFSIDGGGALFQLGPEVVSNQQARLGIASVSTATLGGVTGRLYELRSGGAKDLATSPTQAARVVDEVITKVTQLRGRLGAFQRTTLDTNAAALNDTLSALTEAESSIRDADFAKETAALTRGQILVQSGTAVLGIANQNPQNVLSLLR